MPGSKNKKRKAVPRPKRARHQVRSSKSISTKTKTRSKTPAARRKVSSQKRRTRGRSEEVNIVAFEPMGLGARSGGQSGDLQGLSNLAGADSESVDELLEEGNAFEAEIVKAVQDVPDPDEDEIRTSELLEDDVPEEYLDKD